MGVHSSIHKSIFVSMRYVASGESIKFITMTLSLPMSNYSTGIVQLSLRKRFHHNVSRNLVLPVRCLAVQQQVESAILCETCSGKGWLICDFCEGQKVNVKSESNRIYRRCPSCRATGYILCSKCKVFKCVTFPNADDGADLASGV